MYKIFCLFISLFYLNLSAQSEFVEEIKAMYLTEPTKTIILVDSALFNNNHIDNDIKARLQLFQALSYYSVSEFSKALLKLNSIDGLKNNEEFQIKLLLAKSNTNISVKKFTEASDQALTALKKAKDNNLTKQITTAYNSLSYLHYSLKEYETSLYYLSESVELLISTKDSTELSATYNNMAIIHKNIGNFDKAIRFNNKSLEISELINDNKAIGKSYSNIGRVYSVLGDNVKALKYYNKANENNIKYNIINSIPLRNIAELYFLNNELDLAEEKFLDALAMEEKNGGSYPLFNLYSSLLEIYIKLNDYEKALEYQTKLDSVYQINTQKENEERINMLENQYKLSANENKLEQAKKNNSKNKLIFLIVLVLIILALLFFYQRHKNIKLKLNEEKLRLEQQVLRSQMNPHFIFNVLSAIQNSLLDNEPIQSASYLSKFAKLIRQNFDFINYKTILLVEEVDALTNYIETQKMRYQDKFDYEFDIDEDIDLNSVEIPPLLLQPFVENAIEHAFKNLNKKGLITISIRNETDSYCYQIIDNGQGYDKNKVKDEKDHAIDIFKKRMKLYDKYLYNSFNISTSEGGTIIKFSLKK